MIIPWSARAWPRCSDRWPALRWSASRRTGSSAVSEVVLHRPDVAMLDLQMPGQDGFAATRRDPRAAPDVAVLVLTMFDDDDSVFAAMRAGARGYLVKGAEQEEIGRADPSGCVR